MIAQGLLEGGELPGAVHESVDPWMARGTGVLARMHNRDGRDGFFDYVIITDDAVYLSTLAADEAATVCTFKGFRSADIIAYAFITAPHDGGDPGRLPQLRLMLRGKLRIKLILDGGEGGPELQRRLQQLSAQNPFKRN